MIPNQKCPKCGGPMKCIPIKRRDLVEIIELYCDNCDYSITYYPKLGEIKFKKASFF